MPPILQPFINDNLAKNPPSEKLVARHWQWNIGTLELTGHHILHNKRRKK